MKTLLSVSLLASLLLGACGDSQPQTSEPDAGPVGGTIALVDWVTSMTDQTGDEAAPDTVDDKVGILILTEDPAAFDSYLVEP